MADIAKLKKKICLLRKMVEDEYLLENCDSDKLLRLSRELDKLIFEFYICSRKTGAEA